MFRDRAAQVGVQAVEDQVRGAADAPPGPGVAVGEVHDRVIRPMKANAEMADHHVPVPGGLGRRLGEQGLEIGQPVGAQEGGEGAVFDDVGARAPDDVAAAGAGRRHVTMSGAAPAGGGTAIGPDTKER